MDTFRKRFSEVKVADGDRNKLIQDLLQEVDDMKKQMDRSAFTLVLIDGDSMNFEDELVGRGIAGGEEAAKLLRKEVINDLRYDPDFRHDDKLIVRIYANLRGLIKTYNQQMLETDDGSFSDFVLGFNKAHPLCDFVDSGNHKESADKKLLQTLDLYVYNVHCKHIIFGGSADNSYASFLASFDDADIYDKIRLLKGPPFAYEFRSILHKFKQAEYPEVFRTEKLPVHSKSAGKPLSRIGSNPPPTARLSIRSDAASWRSKQPHPRPERPLGFGSTSELQQSASSSSQEGLLNVPVTLKDLEEDEGSAPEASDVLPEDFPPFRRSLPESSYDSRYLELALIGSTNSVLQNSPKSCDFGVIKSIAYQSYGINPTTWGSTEEHPWYLRSKQVIKWAVEDWMERTDSSPPGNATWLLRHFPPGWSPAAILKSFSAKTWRTPGKPDWPAFVVLGKRRLAA